MISPDRFSADLLLAGCSALKYKALAGALCGELSPCQLVRQHHLWLWPCGGPYRAPSSTQLSVNRLFAYRPLMTPQAMRPPAPPMGCVK